MGYRVPLLDEALAEYGSTFWNLEIKTPAAVAGMLEVLRRFPAAHRLLVTSFWHDTLFAFARTTEIPCGLLIAHRPAGLSSLLPPDLPAVGALVCFCDTTDEAIIREAAERNVDTYVYSPVTRDDHDWIRAAGATGVITDHPELTRST